MSKPNKAPTVPEVLIQFQKQHQELQKQLNPLSDFMEQITSASKVIQNNNQFVNELSKQQNSWQDTILQITSIIPKIDLPTFDYLKHNPLFEYAKRLKNIQEHFTQPDIIKTFDTFADYSDKIRKSKTEAEDNYWHNITIEEYESEISNYKDENTAQKEKIHELETTLKTLLGLLPQPTAKRTTKPARTLKPNITQSQLAQLYEELKDIFQATTDQWRALFSEDNIQMPAPIKANAISDVGLLLHHLKENNLIETTRYPSIIERSGAFIKDDEIVKAKQITDLKSNMNFPTIGKNHYKISQAVSNC